MNTNPSRLRSESGQGLVEYVLILIVAISLGIILMKAFFTPYREWATNFYGTYVTCLLDEGELPTLGADGGVADCVSSGDFPGGGGAGTHGTGGGTGTGGDTKQASDPNANKNKNDSADATASGRSSHGTEVSHNGGAFTHQRVGAADGINDGARGAVAAEAETKAAEKNRGNFRIRKLDSGMRIAQGKPQIVYGLGGLLASEKEKIKKRQEKTLKIPMDESEIGASSRKKFQVDSQKKRMVAAEISADDWSFGKVFRIALIIIIVIVLVLFISGQLVQISKGAEK